MAVIQAANLVSELLNEACIIAGKARDSGDPWGYVSNLKKINKLNLDAVYNQNVTYTISTAEFNKNNLESQLVTSTPQKGQGDEDFESSRANEHMGQIMISDRHTPWTFATALSAANLSFTFTNNEDMIKSTAMFINRLFDMSDLEGINDESERINTNTESNIKKECEAALNYVYDLQKNNLIQPQYCDFIENINSIADRESEYIHDGHVGTTAEVDQKPDRGHTIIEEVNEIVNSYINIALCQVVEIEMKIDEEVNKDLFEHSTEYSSYSYLSDAFTLDDPDCSAFCSDENHSDITPKLFEVDMINKPLNEMNEINYADDICSYEHAYITLNRDYEQYSEEEPVLRDAKCLSMQEIDLAPEQVNETLRRPESITKSMELPSTSKFYGGTSSRKSTLLRRCRLQGRKLFTCVRWWWRRKLTGRRKISRTHGSVGGLCTLSPEARRRANSLLDHIRDEPSTHSKLWKFNTIGGSFFHSSLWKDIGLKGNLKNH